MVRHVSAWRIVLLLAMLALVLLPTVVLAQQNADPALGAPAGSGQLPTPQMFGLDGTVTATIQSYATALQTVGMRIFVALAVLEFLIVMFGSIIQGRPVFEVLGAFVPKMIGFSFFYWLLVLNGWQATQNVIASFYQAGQAAGGVLPTSDSLVTQGVTIAMPMIAYAIILAFIPNYWSFIVAFGYTNAFMPIIIVQLAGAVMVIGSFTILAGMVALTIVEAYLVSVVALIMSAFSALRITHPYSGTKMLAFAVSVGVKLMILELCIGVVQTVLVPQITAYAAFPVIGALLAAVTSVMTLLIAYNASSFASSVVSGVAMGSASSAMSSVTSYINQAQSMAAGLEQTAQGMRDQKHEKELEKEVDSRSNSMHAQSATVLGMHDNSSRSTHTALSGDGAKPNPEYGQGENKKAGFGETGQSGLSAASASTHNGRANNETSASGSIKTSAIPGVSREFQESSGKLHHLFSEFDKTTDPHKRGELMGEIQANLKEMRHDIQGRIGHGAFAAEQSLLRAMQSGAADQGVAAAQIRSNV